MSICNLSTPHHNEEEKRKRDIKEGNNKRLKSSTLPRLLKRDSIHNQGFQIICIQYSANRKLYTHETPRHIWRFVPHGASKSKSSLCLGTTTCRHNGEM
jgi:hypothetical protein